MDALAMSTRVRQAQAYLRTLAARAPYGALFDVRFRTGSDDGMEQLFIRTDRPDTARQVVELGQRTDVYVGCVPRKRPRGRREDIVMPRMLWADCDDPACLRALARLGLPPAMIVASGSEGHVHAYWPLTRALRTSQLEQANRRLAEALGADRKCANASRILRPPGTLNYKSNPPAPVSLVRYQPDVRYDPGRLLALLPAERRPGRAPAPARWGRARTYRERDPLHQIAPSDYVRVLLGRTPRADGKIACPFHEDRNLSLHVYPTAAQGWTCYGCQTPDGKPLGGDIYTLASKLWSISARGRSFLELRAKLDERFGIERAQRDRYGQERARPGREPPGPER